MPRPGLLAGALAGALLSAALIAILYLASHLAGLGRRSTGFRCASTSPTAMA
jgi:hypothetical protein